MGGPKGGGDIRLGRSRGRHRNDFFPITFIVHNQKSNEGAMVGVGGGRSLMKVF